MFNLFKNTSVKRYEKEFNKIWAERNLDYAEILLVSLEVPYRYIGDGYIFVETSKELEEKLTRIGFERFTDNYPEKENLETFSFVMCNKEYNIVLNLFEKSLYKVISLSHQIIDELNLNSTDELAVFVSSIENLKGIVK